MGSMIIILNDIGINHDTPEMFMTNFNACNVMFLPDRDRHVLMLVETCWSGFYWWLLTTRIYLVSAEIWCKEYRYQNWPVLLWGCKTRFQLFALAVPDLTEDTCCWSVYILSKSFYSSLFKFAVHIWGFIRWTSRIIVKYIY